MKTRIRKVTGKSARHSLVWRPRCSMTWLYWTLGSQQVHQRMMIHCETPAWAWPRQNPPRMWGRSTKERSVSSCTHNRLWELRGRQDDNAETLRRQNLETKDKILIHVSYQLHGADYFLRSL